MATAYDIIQRFGSVEDDQRYTRLVELFTEDAVYCDPFAGAPRGKAAIADFMGEMERVIPKMGVYFANWETKADSHVGWSRWEMVVPVDGVEYPIKGQSLYRLRDGKVCFAADYVDSAAYRRIRPDRAPDLADGAALAAAAIDDGRAAEALDRLARITSTPLESEEPA